MRESVKEKTVQKRYDEEFKRQAVELVIHSGKTQAQVARELGVSEYSLTLWKKDYLRHVRLGQLDGQQMGPEEMLEKIRHYLAGADRITPWARERSPKRKLCSAPAMCIPLLRRIAFRVGLIGKR